MTQFPNDRLDRVEAALERQVSVNAELRTSTEVLRASVAELTESTESILQAINQHQDNFMVLVTEIRNIKSDVASLQQTQLTTTATLERMGTILDLLVERRRDN